MTSLQQVKATLREVDQDMNLWDVHGRTASLSRLLHELVTLLEQHQLQHREQAEQLEARD